MSAPSTLSETQEILQDNLDYTLFSWSKQKGIHPIAVQRAEGVYLYDYEGKTCYLDFSSGLMNVNIGHGNQRVTEAVVRQMQEVSYITPSCVTRARGELGKKLAAITPGNLKKTLFTVCGATAIENAIKLARIYTGKHKIIARYRAYHGSSYGALSAGGDPRKLAADAQQAPNMIPCRRPVLLPLPTGTRRLATCPPGMRFAYRKDHRIRRTREHRRHPHGRRKRFLRLYQISTRLSPKGKGIVRPS